MLKYLPQLVHGDLQSLSLAEWRSHPVVTSICSLPRDVLFIVSLFLLRLTDGVVTPGVVVGGVLLPRDHVLRVEQMFVGPYFDL